MKIAIFDIDDTIVEETAFMLENAPRFLKKKYNIDAQIVNPNGYDLKEVYELEEHFRQLGCNDEQAAQKANYVNQEFWNRNFVRYCGQPIKNGVREIVELLRSEGYRIVFLSLRGKRKDGKPTFNDRIKLFFVFRLTAAQLRRGKIHADIIRLVKNKEEKLGYIYAMNPNIVFEDRADIVQEISSTTNIFCVNTPHNEKFQFNNNVIRIDSFDIEKVKDIICHIDDSKSKKQTVLQKRLVRKKSIGNRDLIRKGLTEFVYSTVRIIGRPIALRKYRPIVTGAENIPKRGPVVFAGNHRNKLDPVLIGVTSPRSIHWGALLRMFQGKENLFNSTTNPIPCHLSAAFITAMGAVPIARQTDADYLKINMESIRKLCQILIWGGSAGLFPEGTLNRQPEECNILPLKSDRVFKMAMDTDSLIIPVSVVWLPKALTAKNKVIISYGMPINSRGRTAHEISELWQNAVNSGIETAKEMINKICKETGDIAVQNPDGSYNILGRASDSYVDKNGKRVYLFDIEYSLELEDPVIEWEITAHETKGGTFVVGQVVLKKEYRDREAEAVKLLCEKYNLDAVKIYEKFENSDVTGKRDFQKLKADKTGYYAPSVDGSLREVFFA